METTINSAEAVAQAPKKNLKHHLKNNQLLVIWSLLVIVTVAVAAGLIYFNTMANKIYIEKSEISADKIDLASKAPGLLNSVMVNVGDNIPADTVVAQVGNNLIKNDVAGTVIDAKSNLGTLYAAGQPVVTIVQADQLKVVGSLAEDKGLKDVKIGQTALFKVDAFKNKKYYGTVTEISPTSQDSSVTFNISDKRETKDFTIKVSFDSSAYPELKNGMSAKIWIYNK